NGLEMVHPSYRVLAPGEGEGLGERLDPVYPQIEGIGAASMRRLIGQALDLLPDGDGLESLPADELQSRGLPSLRDALLTVHRPLVLHELLADHVGLRRHRFAWQQYAAPGRGARGTLDARLRASLPFALTAAQERVLAQVLGDIAAPVPMLRLVQGDVGSGKT